MQHAAPARHGGGATRNRSGSSRPATAGHHHMCLQLQATPQHTPQHTSRQQQLLRHRRHSTTSTRAAASDAGGHKAVSSRLSAAMNARDAAAITASLAPSICYANLALAEGTEHRAQSTAIRPLVSGLTGMLPAVQQVSRALQDGANLLLQPLGSSSPQPQPAPAPAPAPAVSTSSSPCNPSAAATSSLPQTGPPPQLERQRLATVAAAAAAAAAAVGKPSGAGAAPQDLSGVPQDLSGAPQDLSGLWVKVPERCDVEGYEAALDVLGLSGLQKVTARLIEGVEIRQSRSSFGVAFVTVVPFFKVTEEAPLDGGSSSQGRRDLRFGRQTAAAATLADGSVEVTLTWGPPIAGSMVERYSLLPDGCLCVAAETRVGDKAASSTTVYTRSQGSREQLLADSKQRNPSVAAVVQRQRDQGLRM